MQHWVQKFCAENCGDMCVSGCCCRHTPEPKLPSTRIREDSKDTVWLCVWHRRAGSSGRKAKAKAETKPKKSKCCMLTRYYLFFASLMAKVPQLIVPICNWHLSSAFRKYFRVQQHLRLINKNAACPDSFCYLGEPTAIPKSLAVVLHGFRI